MHVAITSSNSLCVLSDHRTEMILVGNVMKLTVHVLQYVVCHNKVIIRHMSSDWLTMLIVKQGLCVWNVCLECHFCVVSYSTIHFKKL